MFTGVVWEDRCDRRAVGVFSATTLSVRTHERMQACLRTWFHSDFRRRVVLRVAKPNLKSVVKYQEMQPVGDAKPENTPNHGLLQPGRTMPQADRK